MSTVTSAATSRIDWPAVAAAHLHPLKLQIIDAAAQVRTISPVELADQLDAKIGDVSYHVRQMHDKGVLELVRTEQRRGAVKHFYRLTAVAQPSVDDGDRDDLDDYPCIDHGIVGCGDCTNR